MTMSLRLLFGLPASNRGMTMSEVPFERLEMAMSAGFRPTTGDEGAGRAGANAHGQRVHTPVHTRPLVRVTFGFVGGSGRFGRVRPG